MSGQIIKDLKIQNFNRKLITADVFEDNKKNPIASLWQEAKDIEITLDFLNYFPIIKSNILNFAKKILHIK